MTVGIPLITVLSQKNSVSVLLFLLESGGASKATFVWKEISGNYKTVGIIADRLKESGLITITSYGGKSSYILYELTELGRLVAEDLKRANDRVADYENSKNPASEFADSEDITKNMQPVDVLANKSTKNGNRGGGRHLPERVRIS